MALGSHRTTGAREGASSAADERHDLDTIAVTQLTGGVLFPRHHFFIHLNGHFLRVTAERRQ